MHVIKENMPCVINYNGATLKIMRHFFITFRNLLGCSSAKKREVYVVPGTNEFINNS